MWPRPARPVDLHVPAYRPPLWLRSGHLQTILPTLFRQVDGVAYRRERLDLDDGDFLDLDWVGTAWGSRVAVVAHGLEGSSDRAYVRGMARELARRGWTVCAWNLRGCSGEPNRLLRSYHSGATEDLDAVVLLRGRPAAAVRRYFGPELGSRLFSSRSASFGGGRLRRLARGRGRFRFRRGRRRVGLELGALAHARRR